MADYKYFLVEKKDAVLECWINRPDARNAFSTDVEDEWEEILTYAGNDDDIRVVTLMGKGPVFSAGADLKEGGRSFRPADGSWMPEASPQSGPHPEVRRAAARRLWPPEPMNVPYTLPNSWYFRKTLIAGVHGYVGELCLVRILATFDLVLAAEGTKFSMEHSRIGHQNQPMGLLFFQLPLRVLNQLMLLGGWFSAETAAELRLVQRVVPQAELEDEVRTWAQSAAGLRSETIAAYKEGIHRMVELAGLLNMTGVGNVVNAHAAGGRGDEFYKELQTKGLQAAVAIRGVNDDVSEIR